ncbi:RNA polymerase sigma factor [Candidatus Parcubacteria bacterium]|nr:RNA polymerase sigma factor [Candidatus Parcubacteria bacterium]
MEQKKSQQSDEDIAALVQAGDVDFFGVLIHRYKEKMIRYARKFLSDNEDISDIIQEIFIKAYTNIQSFDINRKFSSWLYRIAHNELVNALKKRKKNTLPLFDLDTFLPYSIKDDSFSQDIDSQDTQKMINKCLDQLEPKYREPIILYYLEDLSYKEIAEVMRIPISTVGIRIKRAKEKMKFIFKKLGYRL